jgi:hypothetical protein
VKKLLTLALGFSLVGMPAVGVEKVDGIMSATLAGWGVIFLSLASIEALGIKVPHMTKECQLLSTSIMLTSAGVTGYHVWDKVQKGKELNHAERFLCAFAVMAPVCHELL